MMLSHIVPTFKAMYNSLRVSPSVTMCASHVFAIKEHSLAGDGCCVRGLVKVTHICLCYTRDHCVSTLNM